MSTLPLVLAWLSEPTAWALYLLRLRALRRARARRPCPPLETPVRIPYGPTYPDQWTDHPAADADDADGLLADLHDQVWPQQEWAAVADCPTLHLDPWLTRNQAAGALRRARRRGGLRRHLPHRIRLCQCGAWHVSSWWVRGQHV